MNVNQEQNSLVVGGNVQDGVPTQQSDPTLVQNSHYLPNGDLTLAADQDLDTWTTKVVALPITAVAALFQIETDSSEPNLVVDTEVDYMPSKYTPHLQTSMPNIAHYIGMIITGADIDQRYQESILTCTAGYLDGIMEILANGTFMYLNQRRDGLTRRYSQLCMLINYSISSMLYPPALPNAEVAMEQQAIIQMLYLEGATSILVQIKQAVIGNEKYTITKAMLNRWAMTTPWHALMYNSQAPLKLREFIVLFNNIYAMNCGKRLTYNNSFVGRQPTLAILPNFDLYVKLTPPGMESSIYNINSKIPQRFVMFARYLLYTEDNTLEWDDGNGDDYMTDNDGIDSDTSEGEGPDEGLAY